jgi:pyruvate/2-oxoglutarate dehydrogenase complex dihydrolipoamide acyltransferase (E2) component
MAVQAGDGMKNIQVGQLIALLAEEGDDISNLEIPKESQSTSKTTFQTASSSSSSSSPSTSTSPTTQAKQPSHAQQEQIKIDHSKPIFPSVMRLLQENGISPDKVKGTGIRGMLTKGDVLAFMGKASSPTGTWKAGKESPIPRSIHKPASRVRCFVLARLQIGSVLSIVCRS